MGPMPETIRSLVALEPLAESAIRSTALIAIAALAALALRRAPAATRHLVWTLALLGCVSMPLASRVVPGWSWSALPAWQAGESATTRLDLDPSPATVAPPAPAAPGRAPGPAPALSTQDPATTSAAIAWRPTTADVLRALPVLWLVGVALMLVRHLFAWAALARVARRAATVTDPAWHAALARHGGTLGLARLPALRVSPRIPVPIVSGTLHPTILLPAEALTWAGERRDAVLLHELAHVRRLDLLTARLAQLASTLYWFDPVVWLAARRQREEAERACDDRVLDAGGRASAYASDLLEIARSAGDRASFDAAALAMARRSQLEGRLLAILDPDRPRGAAGRIAIALSVVIAAASIGVLAAVRPVQSRPVDKTVEMPALLPLADLLAVNQPHQGTAKKTAAASSAALPAPAGSERLLAARSSDQPAAGGSSHWSLSDITKGGTHSSTWNDGIHRGSFKSRGVIRYSDALDDIVGISPGGSVEIEDRRGTTMRRALIRNGSGGIDRGYTVNGAEHPWDAEARAWFATFLIDLDRRSGRFVDQRFPRLMSEGGPTRVLTEIGDMTSDYGRSVYFRRLLTAPLDEPTMRRVVAQAGREIDSDYELARTLMAAAEKHALEDATTRAAFLEATRSLESDYEHGRVLMVLVERKDLSVGLAQGAIASSATIDSDYEQARVMLALAEKGHVKPPLQRDYILATYRLASDYEKGRVLRALLEHGKLASENVGEMLSASSRMGSDYEHANVLVQLAESMPMNDAERAAFVQATEALSSDHERSRALAALGKASGRR